MSVGVDIELTNRCNAKCHFCPRDQTPHQGTMGPEVFTQALHRALELQRAEEAILDAEDAPRGTVNMCGLGEPLLNRHAASYVRQVREAGLGCQISSNGALLDEARGADLIEAGLQSIWLNVGATGELYEEVYGLPFEKTVDNIRRFASMADGSCEVNIVLVDFQRDADHIEAMKTFWRDQGIDAFLQFEIMNRGGSLFVDDMQYDNSPEQATALRLARERGIEPFCAVPFIFLFIGYDGQYYLCCSDWKKEVPLGSVFDHSFHDVVAKKYAHTHSRTPICRTCNHDPLNRLTEALRYSGGVPDETFASLLDATVDGTRGAKAILRTIDPNFEEALAVPRLIPVRST